MKLGIVSDLHCNVEGLRHALALMGSIDRLLCLGDSIYEYRFSNEVVQMLREHQALVIQGNHEEVFFGPQGERARARSGNDPELMDWLAGQPHRRLLELAGSRVLMVHSTPWEPRGTYVYPRSAQLARFADSAAEADVVLYGHTHIQMAERIGDVLVVNPGSAGEGRDTSNDRRLSCAVLDLVTHTVEHHDFDNPALLQ
ncbi:MAG: metallophosphoesterase family protein [Gammaproteobacteria bacterium]|nr:metallophosphoesterase family protein [Gammaproteobacteria bacterium]